MRVIYSQLKELVPGLKAKPAAIGEALTFTGFMMDGFEEITFKGKKDYILSFEVRQNRADCFSVIGLAREVAAYYGLSLKLPRATALRSKGEKRPIIGIETGPGEVKRILAMEFEGVKNGDSPKWLKEFLGIYGMNSKSLLVDFSNYVMIFTGYPSHLLDLDKVKGRISWSNAQAGQKITTLDGSIIKLEKGGELIIKDEEKILALAGMVGGKDAEIGAATSRLFAEMAVYGGAVIRKNSRDTKIVTEASNRLEKDLDPSGAEYAFNMLVSMILEMGGGKAATGIFDYYPKKKIPQTIGFDLNMPGMFAGVPIPPKQGINILKRLDFHIKPAEKKDTVRVGVPPFRTDVSLPEDLVEEVVRIHGYEKIPAHELPALEVTKNITPKHISIINKMKADLSANGFDEILFIPLTPAGYSRKCDYRGWDVVATENAVNENYPELRLSLACGLIQQAVEYRKKNVGVIDIFESGKVFGKKGNGFLEAESLGLLTNSAGKDVNFLKDKIEIVLRGLGFGVVEYRKAIVVPAIANLFSCWNIIVGKRNCGIIYKLKPGVLEKNAYFAEIDIDELLRIKAKAENTVVELIEKLVALDINIEVDESNDLNKCLEAIRNHVGNTRLFSLDVIDRFKRESTVRYTLRVTYAGLSDTAAKEIHSKIPEIAKCEKNA